MSRKPQLPPETDAAISEVLKSGRPSFEAQDWKTCVKILEKAWAMIPGTKYEWDYFPQSMSRTLVMVHLNMKDITGARKWLKCMEEAYAPMDDDSRLTTIGLEEAKIFYVDGQLDKAYEIFDQLYKKWKKRPFEGEDPEYLKFYLAEKKARS